MDEEIPNSVGAIKRKKTPTLPSLEKAIGQVGTQKLIQECGGTRMFIPKTMNIRHRLARILGYEVATKLSEQLGGNTLAIPQKNTCEREKRNAKIIFLFNNKYSVKEIARQFNLTDRSVYSILNNHGKKDDGND